MTEIKSGPKKGDNVSWKSHSGTAHGTVMKKQTNPTQIKWHKVAESKEEPKFIVETDEGNGRRLTRGRYRKIERILAEHLFYTERVCKKLVTLG